jgi:hypothetical protein
LWNLEFGTSRQFLQLLVDKGERVPALEREPVLETDLAELVIDFLALNKTRPPAFEGIGNLTLTDIVTLYEARRWVDAGYELGDYIDEMLRLDSTLKEYIKERTPSRN